MHSDQYVLAFSETISYDFVGFFFCCFTLFKGKIPLLLLTIAVACAASKEERFYFFKLLKHKKNS